MSSKASRKIALYGNFGTQNIGNECTLQTVIENLRQRLPGSDVYCICSDPEGVTRYHGISAVPLSLRGTGVPSNPRRRSRLARAARALLYALPLELVDLVRSWRDLRATTDLMVIGTGVLEDDDAGSHAWMLSFLRWCLAARLRGCRIVFLSIGAGPIPSRFSRTVTKIIFGWASYVSYRDQASKDYMHSIGFDTAHHPVYPDVAFGLALTKQAAPENRTSAQPGTVGVGIIDVAKFEDEAHYRAYLEKLLTFVLWLLGQGFAVRMIHGDALYDRAPLRDFADLLCERGVSESDTRIEIPRIDDVRDLLHVLEGVDVVVASRYHNIILSLALGRPAIGLSYHFKFDALMAEFGLDAYCRHVRTFDPDELAHCFEGMIGRIEALEPAIRAKTTELRSRIDEQYGLVLQTAVATA